MREPELSAEEMAKFNMRPSHDERYRQSNLARSEEVYGKDYADAVRRYMEQLKKKQKTPPK